MRYLEFTNVAPQIGDILNLEFGNTLIESVINNIEPDGVVISLDSIAVNLIKEAVGLKQTTTNLPYYYGDPDELFRQYDDTGEKPGGYIGANKAKKLATNTDVTASNAFNWCMDFFRRMPKEIRVSISNLKNEALIEYLKDAAVHSGAYKKFDFDHEDILDAQDLLQDFYNDPLVNTWADVAAKFKKSVVTINETKLYVKSPSGNIEFRSGDIVESKIGYTSKSYICESIQPRRNARQWSFTAW